MPQRGLMAAIPHLVAVGSLTILLAVITAAVAEDIKIMGLTEKNPAIVDGNRALAYLTGSCQKKQSSMECHLNRIEVKKIDTTPLAEKAQEIIAQVQSDPQSIENFIQSHLPPMCNDPGSIQAMLDATAKNEQISQGERELRTAVLQFCADRSAENLRTMFDRRLKVQSSTCSVWVNSYKRVFRLRGNEWMSQQGPSGPCGLTETHILSNPLVDSKGQITHFNRYRTSQISKSNNPLLCKESSHKEYLFVLEKPWYADCVYIDFSPMTFGWGFWNPRSP
jgi:hypothetical protein